MIESIAHILVSPLNQFLIGLITGLIVLKFTRFNIKIGKVIIGLSCFWFFLCSQYFFSYVLIKPLERVSPPVKIDDPIWQDAQAIWVLACYHFEEQELPRVSQFNDCSVERLVQAANMYRLQALPIYLTGADFVSSSKRMHSEVAAEFLVALGVKQDDIILINKGKNTIEEARGLKSKLNVQKLAVISSATHGSRLLSIMRKANIDSVFIPVDYQAVGKLKFKLNLPSSSSLVRTERAFYEYAALIRDFLNEQL